jgi:FkbM family methyltransferase
LVFFDIGAHFGLFSFAALHYGGPTSKAVAIDPSPVAIKLLNTQAILNESANRLTVIQASVADHSGWQDMVAVGVLASGYYIAPTQELPESELTKTRSITLDGIVDELGVVPTHIKIDVEGHEAAVLRGGRRTFSGNSAPLLFLEVHNQIVRSLNGDPEETLQLLRDYGYEIFTSNDGPIGDDEILKEPLIRVICRKEAVIDREVVV